MPCRKHWGGRQGGRATHRCSWLPPCVFLGAQIRPMRRSSPYQVASNRMASGRWYPGACVGAAQIWDWVVALCFCRVLAVRFLPLVCFCPHKPCLTSASCHGCDARRRGHAARRRCADCGRRGSQRPGRLAGAARPARGIRQPNVRTSSNPIRNGID